MCRAVLLTFAFLMILFGFSGFYMLPKLIQQKIEQQMQLKIGTKNYERFTKIPIPLTVKFYLFNVTNSEQVLAGLERPKFQEVGPFMFLQRRRRDVVDFEDYNRRIRYREYKTFYPMFSETLANRHASETHNNKSHSTIKNDNTIAQNDQQQVMLDPSKTNVTIINLPLLSVLTKLAQLEEGSLKRSIAAKVASRLIKDGKEKILITKPANQFLFDGYRVSLMESARDLVSETLGFNFDSPLPGNKFGFFYGKNGTWNKKENGELTVFTGRNESMNDFMQVENWNDLRKLNVWSHEANDRCNQIRGTDGSQFHPGVTRQHVLSIFSPMICTSIFIKYKEDTSTRDIPLLRFTTPPEVFAAPKKNPQNACYCTIPPPEQLQQHQSYKNANNQQYSSSGVLNSSAKRINDSRCYLDGLMDLSLCQKGAPIAASSPHFYNGDPMLAMAAGLAPNKKLHETYLDIEPMTGAVFRAASRAQLNAFVEQAALDVVDSNIIGHMTPMVAPMLWLEESAEIDEKSSIEFKSRLLDLVTKAKRSFFYAIVGGIVLALIVSIQYWYVTCYKYDRSVSTASLPRAARKGGDAMALRRRNRRDLEGGRQMRENIRLSAGARHSNLAATKSKSPLSPGSGSSAAAKALGVAAVFGAASGGPRNMGARGRGARVADYDGDEEESSKKRLVDWDQVGAAVASTSGTSSGQSSQLDRNGSPSDERLSINSDDTQGARHLEKVGGDDEYDYDYSRQEEDDLIKPGMSSGSSL